MIINRILLLLEQKSLKMADLCRYLDINTSTMANWKTRETDPPVKYIPRICEFLDVSYEYLLTGKEHREISSAIGTDSEWSSLINKLSDENQLKLKGYIDCLLEHQCTDCSL